MEQQKVSIVSIFEKHFARQCPNRPFVWAEPKEGMTIDPLEIIYEGELKELNSSSGAVHSAQYFIATKDYLIRCYSAKDRSPRSVLRLCYPRLELVQGVYNGFYFKNAGKKYTLLADSSVEAEKWFNSLKRNAMVVLRHATSVYAFGQLIGRGNYAKVHVATNKQTGEKFAIKSINKAKLLSSDKSMSILLNEIEILRYLKHPTIITLYEVYESAEYVHLIIEYLKGGELFDKIQEKGTYSEKDAAKVMKQLLDAINYCHQKNVIHRDIKPENIILQDTTSDLDFKIVDFGLAAISKPGTKELLRCGSPGYAAPEVLLKEGYTLKADIFSCGIIMSFLLTGTTPFAAGTIEEIIEKNKKCEFTIDGDVWKNVSAEAKDLVEKLTTRNPDKRITAETALQHPWFYKDFVSAEILSTALENMRKYSKESNKGENMKPKADLAKLSLLTSSPILGGRGLDLKETDSPIVSPHITKKPAFESRMSLFRQCVNEVKETKESSPTSGIVTLQSLKAKPEQTESSTCAVEDEMTEQILVPEFRPRTNSIKTIASFVPGDSGIRFLPDTPGSLGGSRRAFRNSVHFRGDRKLLSNFAPEEDVAEFPSMMKRRSEATRGPHDILEEEKGAETERLPLARIAVTRSDVVQNSNLKNLVNDPSQDGLKPPELEVPKHKSETDVRTNHKSDVEQLRKNLLKLSQG